MRLPAIAILLATSATIASGCGTDDNSQHGSMPNTAGVDAAATNVVRVDTPEAADFAAYRAGGGPWQTPALGSDGSDVFYTLDVADDYILVLVCDNAGSGSAFDAEEFAFTYEGDGAVVDASCVEYANENVGPGPMTSVTGTMVQPGRVEIEQTGSGGTTTEWRYSVDVPSGLHDLLAIDDNNIAVYDKGLALDGSAVVGPDIDTGSGAALIRAQLTVTGIGDAALLVGDYVVSNDTELVFFGSGTVAYTMPLSELGSGDYQSFQIDAIAGVRDRGVYQNVEGAAVPATTLAMLPPLDIDFATSAETTSASWSKLPVSTYDELEMLAEDGGPSGTQGTTASSSWISAHDATTLEFDTSAPGYRDAWKVDSATGYVELYLVRNDATTGIYYMTSTGTMSLVEAPARRWRRPVSTRGR